MDKIISILSIKEFYRSIITIGVGYVIYLIIVNIVHFIINRGKDEFERKKRVTVINLIEHIIKWLTWVVILIIILNNFGVNTTAIITSLGAAGVILGLALQDTVKDLIGGVSIIFGDYFVVGDMVDYNGFLGTVIDLNLKSTKILKVTGEVKIIANKNIDEIINLSQKKASNILRIPTAYEMKKEKVEVAIARILVKIRNLKYVTAVDYLGIDDFGESAIYYAIKITCRQTKRWDIKRAALGIIKEEYDKADIKIPYNQIEIRQGKEID